MQLLSRGVCVSFFLSIQVFFIFLFSGLYAGTEQTPTCWLPSANAPDSDFPITNLPYGVFRRAGTSESFRIGVAIGDSIFDLKGAVDAGVFESLDSDIRAALQQETLNALMSLPHKDWHSLRTAIMHLLAHENATLRDNVALRNRLLIQREKAEMSLPVAVGDYTDFYTSINHALNVGKLFRPDTPLFPNFRSLPVAYHGRASSIVLSGNDVLRPSGQIIGKDGSPSFEKTQKLDYEMELGAFVGQGNELGHPIAMKDAFKYLFGVVILNDWSARDVQKWEYQPLGPFNGKNFCTSISPWVVTLEALEPYRLAQASRGDDEPPILPYLRPVGDAALDITVEVWMIPSNVESSNQEPILISQSSFSDQYWTFEQMLVHHASSGCNLRPGDMMGTGTISGTEPGTEGCLLELTKGGKVPLQFPDGSTRRYLEDGDEVVMRAYCQKDGLPRVGFGECRARVH